MLQNTTPTSNSGERFLEASAIISELVLMWIGSSTVPVAPPALARRMSDNRIRSLVFARIALNVP